MENHVSSHSGMKGTHITPLSLGEVLGAQLNIAMPDMGNGATAEHFCFPSTI